MDGWTMIMYNLMDFSFPLLACMIFILLVVIGSFFLINLILAVILRAFINIQQEELVSDFEKKEELFYEVIELLKYEAKVHEDHTTDILLKS
jgi:hypothetical protein